MKESSSRLVALGLLAASLVAVVAYASATLATTDELLSGLVVAVLIVTSLYGVVSYAIVALVGIIARRLTRGRTDQTLWIRRSRYAATLLLMALAVDICYTAVYPSDKFFLDEFADAALRDPPPSAKVVAKSASYPDFFGGYCSFSRINLSGDDFSGLLSEIECDGRYELDEDFSESEEQSTALKGHAPIAVLKSFRRQEIGLNPVRRSLIFMGDTRSLQVTVCHPG